MFSKLGLDLTSSSTARSSSPAWPCAPSSCPWPAGPSGSAVFRRCSPFGTAWIGLLEAVGLVEFGSGDSEEELEDFVEGSEGDHKEDWEMAGGFLLDPKLGSGSFGSGLISALGLTLVLLSFDPLSLVGLSRGEPPSLLSSAP